MAEAAMELRVAQAIALQSTLAREVICKDGFDTVRYVCGIDVRFTEDGLARAAAAVLTFPRLELCDYAVVRKAVRFPYIPGLLSFREVPPALAALDKLTVTPGLLLCDGHGIAHPRRFGLASHIGLLAGIPSIGVAKTRLVGGHAEPPQGRGAWEPLVDRGERIGAVLRTRTGVRPVYVSVGHRVSLETAVRYVLACATRYRLPETTRWAHRLAGASVRDLVAVQRSLAGRVRCGPS